MSLVATNVTGGYFYDLDICSMYAYAPMERKLSFLLEVWRTWHSQYGSRKMKKFAKTRFFLQYEGISCLTFKDDLVLPDSMNLPKGLVKRLAKRGIKIPDYRVGKK